jgi:hypothetical protein
MIDREKRDRFAEQVRHFAAGVVTVEQYEERADDLAFAARDSGIDAVWNNVWGLYDDFRTDRLRGEWALDPVTRRTVALCILFLYSDTEYQWPDDAIPGPPGCLTGLARVLLNMATLGLCRPLLDRRHLQRWQEWDRRVAQFGDIECWPFLHRAELEAASRYPRLLVGHRR